MKSILDVCYGQNPLQRLDVYLPECKSFPVFVYFHGGGLENGDKAHDRFYKYVVNHGIAVVSANYRMYPTARYPDFLTDAATAVAWVFNNIADYGIIEGIYVGGSSAGGYISQMLCFNKQLLAAHGISPMQISGFIHDTGQPTAHFNVLKERGIDSRRVTVDETAPLFYVGADPEYPPMLIIVSDNDMQNRYEQTMLLVATLKHFGHTKNIKLKVMHGGHCAYVNRFDENNKSVFGEIVYNYIKEKL